MPSNCAAMVTENSCNQCTFHGKDICSIVQPDRDTVLLLQLLMLTKGDPTFTQVTQVSMTTGLAHSRMQSLTADNACSEHQE